MTDSTDFDGTDAPLPGLEPTPTSSGAVEAAARRSLAALEPVLDERHAVMMEALLTGARQLDRAASSPKSKDYGVANLLVQLRETFVVLMPDESGGGEGLDAFDQLAADLRAAAGLAAGLGSPPAIRDPS